MKLRRVAPRLAVGVLATCVVAGGGSWAAMAASGTAASFGPAALAAAPAEQITEIVVTAQPARTVYTIGSRFDATGLVVSATTAGGETRELDGDAYALSGFDSNTPGGKTVTVALTGAADVKTTFVVQVEDVGVPTANLLENGSFQTGKIAPWEAAYAVGSGEVATGSRTNGVSAENGQDGNAGFSFWDRNVKTEATVSQTIADLPRGYYTVSGYGTGNTGDAVSTISVPELEWSAQFELTGGGNWQQQSHSFAWKGGDLTLAFAVQMLKNGGWAAFDNFSLVRTAPDEHVKGIAVTSSKTEYTVGDELDLSGIAVRKVMDDDTTFALDSGSWTASGFDGSAAGTQVITVALKADPRKTTTFEVTVREREAQVDDIKTMSIATPPWRTTYKQGRALDLTGLRITGADASGETRTLAADEYRITGFKAAVAGDQTVTVALRTDPTVSASFSVTVIEKVAEGVYTLSDLGASSTDGVVSVKDGHAVIDLSKIPAGNGTVVIERGALTAPITSLRFTPATGDVLDMRVEDWALAQQGEPTLRTIAFPEGLDTLVIGESAAHQYTAAGSATLTEVLFPRDLIALEIGDGAFRQDARDAAALRTITFPQQLRELTVGAQAFRQKYGTAGGLESVNLPGGLDHLDIGLQAFSLSPSYKAGQSLRSIYLGSSEAGRIGQVRLGEELTRAGSPLHPDQSRWLWLGAKSTVQAVFGAGLDAPAELAGTAVDHGFALRFNDGTASESTAARGMPSDTGFVPVAGEPASWQQSIPSAAPQRAGFTFAGWSADADATTADFAAGDRVTLSDTSGEGMTLYAVWAKADDGTDPGPGDGGDGGDGGGDGGTGGEPGTDQPGTGGQPGAGDGAAAGDGSATSNGQDGALAVTGYAAGGLGLMGLLALAAGLFMKLRAGRSARSSELG